jgi:SpoOM protein
MGLLDTIKGWFNIGGVSVKLQGVNPMVPKTGNKITGQVLLSTKTDKQIKNMTYKLLLKQTTGHGNDRKTKDYVLAQTTQDQPFELKKDETKTLDFTLPYSIEKSLKDMGGMLGAIGKIGAFATSERNEYFVVAQCGVKGAALSPSASVPVTIVD